MLNQLYTVLDHISSLFDVYKVHRYLWHFLLTKTLVELKIYTDWDDRRCLYGGIWSACQQRAPACTRGDQQTNIVVTKSILYSDSTDGVADVGGNTQFQDPPSSQSPSPVENGSPFWTCLRRSSWGELFPHVQYHDRNWNQSATIFMCKANFVGRLRCHAIACLETLWTLPPECNPPEKVI